VDRGLLLLLLLRERERARQSNEIPETWRKVVKIITDGLAGSRTALDQSLVGLLAQAMSDGGDAAVCRKQALFGDMIAVRKQWLSDG